MDAMVVGISVRQFSPKYRSTDERKHRLADIGGYRFEDRHLGDAEGWCNQNHALSPSRRCSSPRWLQDCNTRHGSAGWFSGLGRHALEPRLWATGFQLPTSRFGDRELRAQGDVG